MVPASAPMTDGRVWPRAERHARELEIEDLVLPIAAEDGILVRVFRATSAPRPAAVVLLLCEADGGEDRRDDRQARHLAAAGRSAIVVPRLEHLDSGIGRGRSAAVTLSAAQRLHGLVRWIAVQGERRWLDGGRIAVVADGAHAALACRLTLATSEEKPLLSATWLGWSDGREGQVLTKLASLLDAVLWPPADVRGEPQRPSATGSGGG